MDNRQKRTLESFGRALDFFNGFPIVPEPPLLTGMKKSLSASIARIKEASQVQHNTMRFEGGHVEWHQQKLRRGTMIPLVRTVKPLLSFAPGAEAVLRVPHARANARTVTDAAIRIADLLDKHVKLLSAAGYSREFLRQLRQEAKDLALAANKTQAARLRCAQATATIAAELRKGMRTLTVMEGLVMHHHGSNDLAVSIWRNRRRVTKRIGRPKTRTRANSRPPADSSGTQLMA